ncbi:MAG: hypothetical protein KDC34_01870 [Saprospiraceae bacterium]|nr:hypothetical protein [Saprospiraceae bacterium]
MKVLFEIRPIPFVLLLLVVAGSILSGCKVIENAIERGFKQASVSLKEEGPSLEELTANLSESAVRAAMETLANDSLNQAILSDWQIIIDSLLGQVGDSLHISSETLISDLLGKEVDSLLQARINTLGFSLRDAYENLEPAIRQSLSRLIEQDINRGVIKLIQSIQLQLNSPETYASLDQFRIEMARQIDSLLLSSIGATSRYTDILLIPKVDDLADRVEVISTDTQKKASNLVWLIGLAGAALLFLAGLIRLYLQQQKYREMVKIFTSKIDSIEQQTVYDNLVGKISAEMQTRDLEDPLRDILEEQDLIEQPEWEDKDYQVNQLLLSQLKESAEGKPVDQETWMNSLFEKARKLGLEDHLRSVINRKQ